MKKPHRFRSLHVLSFVGALLVTQIVWAYEYSVCTAACDFMTIQSAVNFAQNGDTIAISKGVYREDITIIDKNLHLKGEDRIQTHIHGNGIGLRSAITLECGNEDRSIKITDLSITSTPDNSSVPTQQFVGLHNERCSLTIRNALIHNNIGVWTGGGVSTSGPTIVKDSTIADNHKGPGVGGIEVLNGGSLILDNSVIERNSNGCGTGARGGGIANFGEATIINSSIMDNQSGASCRGGGIYNAGSLLVKGSVVSGNKGGGIFNDGAAKIVSSLINNNDRSGIENYAKMRLKSSLVTENQWRDHSGIINLGTGEMEIMTSVVSRNQGGGISNYGSLRIMSTTISENTFGSGTGRVTGGGIYNVGELVLRKSFIIHNGFTPVLVLIPEGGGIYNENTGIVSAFSTVIENNQPDNCAGVGFTCP
jgi:hypothetical protein